MSQLPPDARIAVPRPAPPPPTEAAAAVAAGIDKMVAQASQAAVAAAALVAAQVVTQMEAQLLPIAASQQRIEASLLDHATRITKIESQQRKALWGWGAYCTVISAFIGWALYLGFDWVKTRLRGSP